MQRREKESRMESLTRWGRIEIPMAIDIESGSQFSLVFHGPWKISAYSFLGIPSRTNAKRIRIEYAKPCQPGERRNASR